MIAHSKITCNHNLIKGLKSVIYSLQTINQESIMPNKVMLNFSLKDTNYTLCANNI